jgi:putative ABC transport system substrate-binding protein
MNRRELMTTFAGAALLACGRGEAHAQPNPAIRRLGILTGFVNQSENDLRLGAFRQELRTLGWLEGRNLEIVYRQGDNVNRLEEAAKEVVAAKPEVILATPNPAMQALSRATRTIPVVFGNVSDPIEGGFVASLARPGGNATGFTAFEYSLGGKWLEILKEMAPATRRVLVLYVDSNYSSRGLVTSIQAAGPSLGVELMPVSVRNADDIKRAFEKLGKEPGGGLLMPPHIVFTNNIKLIFALAEASRIAAVYPFHNHAALGGLAAYGAVESEAYRSAAHYVHRILNGEKPGDLPVQNPTKFELVVNLKAAMKIGLTIPSSFLIRADEVIE